MNREELQRNFCHKDAQKTQKGAALLIGFSADVDFSLRHLCLFVAKNSPCPYSELAYFWMSRWLRAAVSSMMNWS